MDLNQVGQDFWATLGELMIPILIFGSLGSLALYWAMSSAAAEREVRTVTFGIRALTIPCLVTYFLYRNNYEFLKAWAEMVSIYERNRLVVGGLIGLVVGAEILFFWILFPRYVYSTKFRPDAWKAAGEEDRLRMVGDFLRRYSLEDHHEENVLEILGEPDQRSSTIWRYKLPRDQYLVIEFAPSGRCRPPRYESRF